MTYANAPPSPLRGFDGLGAVDLALKRQALFLCPFGAI